ncbi:MAG: hypothetical protein NVS2B8_20820 [Vulcanimicrobiaceae bacterium]
MKATLGLIATLLVGTSSTANAVEAAKSVLLSGPAAVAWKHGPSDLPPGSRIAVLSGDPAKPGPFVLRVEFPAHTLVAQHRHATTENLTVISGDFYHGIGEKVDTAHEHLMQTGGFLYLPGNVPHYLRTREHVTVVQVTGTGPFGLQYVHAAHHAGSM